MQPAPLTGTATPIRLLRPSWSSWTQPAPLTGTATIVKHCHHHIQYTDATRTPHGDCNCPVVQRQFDDWRRMHPHPSRGLQLDRAEHRVDLLRCNPHPSRGQFYTNKNGAPLMWRAILFTHFSLCFDHTCLLAAYSIHIILPLSDPTGRVWLVSTLLSQVCPLQSAVPAGYSATDTRIG